ncbi:pannexin-3 [Crotalus tigris]|uniref:pannexin-3 n=1 Tax=Crotalus tigris TaxID=88082 RepID=UPI00192FB4CB|nr:pannexin-3 [Crotalus tigris]
MSIAHTAGKYMLSDALLPDPNQSRAKGLYLELPCDRIMKFVTVGLPLFLVSLMFAQEFSTGSQISCFSPSNFTAEQSHFVDAVCWDSLLRYDSEPAGDATSNSLWVFKVFPYSLLVIAVAMYLPYLLWKYAAAPSLNCDLFFIIDELDKSYNRSIRLVQYMVKLQQSEEDPEDFWEELDLARSERYFEFPLLERYLTCKQRSHYLIIIYVLRNLFLLFLLAVSCLYLGYCHPQVFFHDKFRCSIKAGLLGEDSDVPDWIPCKLVFFSVFQVTSICLGSVYILVGPVVLYHLLQLCQWDKRLLSIYEMLPAFDLLSKKMLTCPFNDLNIILLFLRANISEVKSFSRLSVLSTLKDISPNKESIDTVVDFMTLLAGLQLAKPKHNSSANENLFHRENEVEMKPALEAKEK